MKIDPNALPYEGNDHYVFLSYCHKDQGIVFPIIEWLVRHGCRIWFDQGIETGADWAETIAQHLIECSTCMVFLSKSSIASHNCKNELNYAVEHNKQIIPLIYQHPIIPNGIRLMLSSAQWMELSDRPSEDELNKLLISPALQDCRGVPDQRVAVQPYLFQDKNNEAKQPVPELDIASYMKNMSNLQDNRSAPSEAEASGKNVNDNQTPPVTQASIPLSSSMSIPSDIHTSTPPETPSLDPPPISSVSDEFDKTIVSFEDPFDSTVVMPQTNRPVIIVIASGKRYVCGAVETLIGRSMECQIVLPNPERTISKQHAKLTTIGSQCFLSDLDSANGTFLNDNRLTPGNSIELTENAEVKIYRDPIYIAIGNSARQLAKANRLLILQSAQTGENRYVYADRLELGRNHPWKCGAMTSRNISHEHATIYTESSGFYLEDHSQNGTTLNGEPITPRVKTQLSTGDIIRIGSERLTVRIIEFEEEHAS